MAKRIAVAGLTVLSGLIGVQSFAQKTGLNGSVGAITTAVPFFYAFHRMPVVALWEM